MATLGRISRVYGGLAILVPALGLITALRLDVLTDAWVLLSIALTALAAVLLVAVILPTQSAVASDPGSQRMQLAKLRGVSGAFAVLWAVVVVLMIYRPGSTTGG
jgi:hypothetical protein